MYLPDECSPPGDTIKETIDSIGMSKEECAFRLEMDDFEFDNLLSGVVKINYSLAKSLEFVLKIPCGFWVKRESDYRECLSRNN